MEALLANTNDLKGKMKEKVEAIQGSGHAFKGTGHDHTGLPCRIS